MVKSMERVHYILLVVINMLVNGKMVDVKAKEHIIIVMVIVIKANGVMMNDMVKV